MSPRWYVCALLTYTTNPLVNGHNKLLTIATTHHPPRTTHHPLPCPLTPFQPSTRCLLPTQTSEGQSEGSTHSRADSWAGTNAGADPS